MATHLRPVPLADKYEAFVIASVHLSSKGKAYPAGEAADSLDRCLQTTPLIHKQHFYVRHTDALSGQVMLSFYVVKKAKPTLRYHDYQHRMIADLYAEHLFDLNGSNL